MTFLVKAHTSFGQLIDSVEIEAVTSQEAKGMAFTRYAERWAPYRHGLYVSVYRKGFMVDSSDTVRS
jgi:hypothetical protein